MHVDYLIESSCNFLLQTESERVDRLLSFLKEHAEGAYKTKQAWCREANA